MTRFPEVLAGSRWAGLALGRCRHRGQRLPRAAASTRHCSTRLNRLHSAPVDWATTTMTPPRKPASAPPSNSDADDASILAEALADVTPLSEESRQRVMVPPAPQRAPIGPPRKEASDPALKSGNDWTSGYAAPGVRRDQVRKLKRGEIPLERMLDLHGCTVEEALGRLSHFVAGCRHAGVRCIRVVHGKGAHSPSGAGVLRDRVWDHLTRRHDVLIVEFAQPWDGGHGAACVLLRK